MANAQKVRTRSNASKIKVEDVATLGMTYAWRNAQYHQAGQVALQVVETAAAVVLNTVGNIAAGAGSAIMAAYHATKQAYLGSLNGGTKGALAGLASGVVSGALTYAVGAYGGDLLGKAAEYTGINVNAGYTFEGGWTGGLGFNFSGVEGKGLGFGANIQFAEGRGAVGGSVDLSFGRGGGRTGLTLNSDNTARIGYTTPGAGPRDGLRGNAGVTLDKKGITSVDASASYTNYYNGGLFGRSTQNTITNNAGLFYNRDGSYGITTSTNIGIADPLGFGINRVGANTNERYTWGRGGGFQGTTQNITTEVGFQNKEQALKNIRKRTNDIYAQLEKGNPTAEEEAALREELQFLKQRDAQADPWTAMYNTVMARTDIPQSVKDEIRKNPDLLLDHDYMKSVLGDGPGTAESRTSVWEQITGAVGDAADWLVGDSSSDLGYVDEDGKFVYRTCFVAGTKVRTSEGFKNIEDIEAGDFVLSFNEKTGEQSYSRVTHAFTKQADRIYELTFEDGTVIETSWNHPFYIRSKGWVEAKDLHPGDVSVTASGGDLIIRSIRIDARYETVYNFSVESDHTYYVSEAEVLVHNQGCPPIVDAGLVYASQLLEVKETHGEAGVRDYLTGQAAGAGDGALQAVANIFEGALNLRDKPYTPEERAAQEQIQRERFEKAFEGKSDAYILGFLRARGYGELAGSILLLRAGGGNRTTTTSRSPANTSGRGSSPQNHVPGPTINPNVGPSTPSRTVATRYNYRANYQQAHPSLPSKYDVHHSIPQKFEETMRRAGVNIHENAYLRGVPSEIHPRITADWIKWERNLGRTPTADEIIKFQRIIDIKYRSAFYP
jgi:Pretoxin HINT domain